MMNKNILISIIVVTFNAGKHLQNLLNSVKKRINSECELILVDGCSSDNTLTIILSNNNIIDKYISEKDSGIYDAMEKGVRLAEGRYLLFLGADDELVINLSEMKHILNEKNTIYYGDVLLKEKNQLYGGKFNTAKLISRNFCHQSMFFPRELFEVYKFEKKYKLMADYVMNIQLWADKLYTFKYIQNTIAIYSLNGVSGSMIDLEFKNDILKLIYDKFGFYGLFLKMLNPIRKTLNF